MSQAEIDLHQPMRQAPAALIFIVFKFGRRLFKQFWPLILILIFGAGNRNEGGYWDYIWIIFLVISGVQLVFALLNYFRHYFYVEGNELVVEHGILNRSRINVPFERIQAIDFEQNVLHQFLNVVSLKVETAGSSGSELSLDALHREHAETIRNFILEQKKDLKAEINSSELTAELPETIPDSVYSSSPNRLLFSRTPAELVREGVSQNHLQTMGIILGTLLGFGNTISDALGYEWEDVLYAVIGFELDSFWLGLLILFPILLVATFLYSLIRTVIRYYGLSVWETDRGFKITAGLFDRREQTAVHQKLQFITWSTQPLKQLFGLFTVRIYQASSQVVKRQRALTIPACPIEDVETLLQPSFPESLRAGMTKHVISPFIVGRHLRYYGIIPALALMLLTASGMGWQALIWLLLIPLVWLLSRRFQQRYTYSLNPDLLHIHSGIIGTKESLLAFRKVQAVSVKQTPFQQRKGLANLVLFTAAGAQTIPYIELAKAQQIRDYVLYVVETDQEDWM